MPTDAGFAILPTATFDEVGAADILCVPGGIGVAELMTDAAAMDWVRQVGGSARWVTSVCTGSLILGAAGLLRGYRATSHWAWRDDLRLFGAEPVAERVVVDRNRITGGGVTAGIDFAFVLTAAIRGEAHARLIQLGLEYDPHRRSTAAARTRQGPISSPPTANACARSRRTARKGCARWRGRSTPMAEPPPAHLPAYASDATRKALLAAGASGTIYSLVMPESEAALAFVVDGGDSDASRLDAQRREHFLSRYHEPWTQKQDSMHEAYFEHWLSWSAPVVSVDAAASRSAIRRRARARVSSKSSPSISPPRAASASNRRSICSRANIEGFGAYAEALGIRTVRHDRLRWQEVPAAVARGAMFSISQPSAIDGAVWEDFDRFVGAMAELRPEVPVVPDLTYVGSRADVPGRA